MKIWLDWEDCSGTIYLEEKWQPQEPNSSLLAINYRKGSGISWIKRDCGDRDRRYSSRIDYKVLKLGGKSSS